MYKISMTLECSVSSKWWGTAVKASNHAGLITSTSPTDVCMNTHLTHSSVVLILRNWWSQPSTFWRVRAREHTLQGRDTGERGERWVGEEVVGGERVCEG